MDRSSIQVREYRPTDRAYVARSLDAKVAELAAHSPLPLFQATPGWGAAELSHLLARRQALRGIAVVVDVGSEPAGFAFGLPDRFPAWMRRPHPFSRPALLDGVFVEPRFRRSDAGSRLLDELERRLAARGCDWVRVFGHPGQSYESALLRRRGYGVNVVGTGRRLDGRRLDPGRRARGVHLRQYAPEDRRFLERSLEALLVEKARLTPTRDVVPSRRWGRPYARFLLAERKKLRGVALVAEVRGERAGFAFAQRAPFPSWELRSLRFQRPCQLNEMYVLPRFRRNGVGGALLREMERRFTARGHDWLIAFHHGGHLYESNLYRRCDLVVTDIGRGKWLRPRDRTARR